MEDLIVSSDESISSSSVSIDIVMRCQHCESKVYSINTSKTHLKKHTMSCPSSPLNTAEGNPFKLVTKDDVDSSIVDLIVRTGMSFNILNNPLFHKMAKQLHYIVNSYKIPYPTTISRHITDFKKSGQTAKDITSVIMNTLENYSIKEKIFGLTMDNTTTNKAVSRMLQSELPNIKLVSIAGLKEISSLQMKVHKVMKYLANPLTS
ncbi:3894_t:CDS:2, partial [Scutellospora calospora]